MTGKCWSVGSGVLLLLLLMSILMPIAHVGHATAITVPAGILYYVPITLTNSQSSPTPAPFQQMIQVNSSGYSMYEAANLQNVEFFDSTGTVIPSWLESGDNNTASNTFYWISLASGISATSSVTVYMGFSSMFSNLMNSQTTGEAPTLSASYGQYDDGANVFEFFDNFAGTQLDSSLWMDNSATSTNTFSINDGLTLAPATTLNNWAALSSVQTFSVPAIVEYFGLAETGVYTPYDVGGGGIGLLDINRNSVTYGATGNVQGIWASTSSAGGVFQTSNPASDGIRAVTLTESAVMTEYDYGYALTETSTVPLPGSYHVFFVAQHHAGIVHSNWVRVRSYPPNGVMPSATEGNPTPVPSVAVDCSPTPVTLGYSAMCTATVTGNSPTGTVNWSTSGSGAFFPPSCTLSSGSCQTAYVPANAASPLTITASYGGDANNPHVVGTFFLSVSKASSTTNVDCSPSPVMVGSSTICTATVAGHSPSGNIAWSSSGGAYFSPASSCTLYAQSCSVAYTPSSPASPVTITATYAGDQDNEGSSDTFALSVASTTTATSTANSTSSITSTSTSQTSSQSSTASSTSTTSSSTTSSTSTTSSSTASSSASIQTTTTSSTSSGGGGIPEFPYQMIVIPLFTAVLVLSYLVARRRPSSIGLTPIGTQTN